MVRVAAYPPRRSPYRIRASDTARSRAGIKQVPELTPLTLPRWRSRHRICRRCARCTRHRSIPNDIEKHIDRSIYPHPIHVPDWPQSVSHAGAASVIACNWSGNLVSNALFSRIVRRSTSLRGKCCMGALRTQIRTGAAIAATVAGQFADAPSIAPTDGAGPLRSEHSPARSLKNFR
jgi:hypothetical protein